MSDYGPGATSQLTGRFGSCVIVVVLACTPVLAQEPDWETTLAAASGKTVYLNAWGGDLAINQYIDWAAERIAAEHGIELRHVKVGDISEAVTRILAERTAGRDDRGSVDLLWINGENFAALKQKDLLHGPWVDSLPHAELIDWDGNPTTRFDATLATDGYEMPWGTSALTFFFDRHRVGSNVTTPDALMDWIKTHPGRFSYPQPPSFLGSAFLKQLLAVLVDNPDRLQEPAGDDFQEVTQPLWDWLDNAHPSMWRRGRLFPLSGPAQRDLLAVGELDWMLSYNPAEASRAIRQGDLHSEIGAMHLAGGALANSHFLAIPYNSSAKDAARVVANFLLSPAAQARKADERFWGDPTVLNIRRLDAASRDPFEQESRSRTTPPPARRFVGEPHSSWTKLLEQTWRERYVR